MASILSLAWQAYFFWSCTDYSPVVPILSTHRAAPDRAGLQQLFITALKVHSVASEVFVVLLNEEPRETTSRNLQTGKGATNSSCGFPISTGLSQTNLAKNNWCKHLPFSGLFLLLLFFLLSCDSPSSIVKHLYFIGGATICCTNMTAGILLPKHFVGTAWAIRAQWQQELLGCRPPSSRGDAGRWSCLKFALLVCSGVAANILCPNRHTDRDWNTFSLSWAD